MKQTLTQRVEALEQYRNSHIDWHRDNNPKPYTAMRSTGEGETYSLSEKMGLPNRGYVRMPIKPQEDKKCVDVADPHKAEHYPDGSVFCIECGKWIILAIVKGE